MKVGRPLKPEPRPANCPKCNATRIGLFGYAVRKEGKIRRYKCLECGTVFYWTEPETKKQEIETKAPATMTQVSPMETEQEMTQIRKKLHHMRLDLHHFIAELERAENAENKAEIKRLANMAISEMLMVLGDRLRQINEL